MISRARILLIVVATVVVAAIVSTSTAWALFERDSAGDGGTNQVIGQASPVSTDRRATVGLTTRSIQPIVSSDGRVVTGDAGSVIEAPVSSSDLAYRLLSAPYEVRALIQGGPAGFVCAWQGLVDVPESPSGVSLRCAVPPDVAVVPGLLATVVIAAAPPEEAMALPASAVVGSAGQGRVVVVTDDGMTVARDVTLGTSDAYWVEITGGLEPDETVLEIPVEADFRGLDR